MPGNIEIMFTEMEFQKCELLCVKLLSITVKNSKNNKNNHKIILALMTCLD